MKYSDPRWRKLKPFGVHFLVICLAFLSLETLVAAEAPNCQIIVDQRIAKERDYNTLFFDSKVYSDSQYYPVALFQGQSQFNDPNEIQQLQKLFPNDHTFRLVAQGLHYYLIFQHHNLLNQSVESRTYQMDKSWLESPLPCQKLQSWAKTLQGEEAFILPLYRHLVGLPTERTLGEAFIMAEALAYTKAGENYDLPYYTASYRSLLRQAHARLEAPIQNLSYREKINVVREILKEQGLRKYCRNDISFKDFIDKPCTNCQGQSFLFTALLMDLKLNSNREEHLGLQLFKDHIRPVLYDNDRNDVADIVYAFRDSRMEDPIYAPEALMVFALRRHASLFNETTLDFLQSHHRLKPINFSLLDHFQWPWRNTKGAQGAPAPLSLHLYDFSGAPTKTHFNLQTAPETATLNLEQSFNDKLPLFEDPSKIPSLNKKNGIKDNFKDGRLDLSFPIKDHNDGRLLGGRNWRCDDENINYKILNKQEISEVKKIQAQSYMTLEQINRYGDTCPGYNISDRTYLIRSGYSMTQYEIEDFLSDRPYKERLEKARQRTLHRFQQILSELSETFLGPLEEVPQKLIDRFGKYHSFGASLRAELQLPYIRHLLLQRHFYFSRVLNRGLFDDPQIVKAQKALLESYFDLQSRIQKHPREFLEALAAVDPKSARGEITPPFHLLFAEVTNYFQPQWDPLVARSPLNESSRLLWRQIKNDFSSRGYDIDREIEDPFASTLKKVLIAAPFRVATSPWKIPQQDLSLIDQTKVFKSPGTDGISPPVSDFPDQYLAFQKHCQQYPHQLFQIGFMAWSCESLNEISPQEVVEDLIVPYETMGLLISLMEHQLDPKILSKLIGGLDRDFFRAAFHQFSVGGSLWALDIFPEIVALGPYILTDLAPQFQKSCLTSSTPQILSVCQTAGQLSFRSVVEPDSTPPFWVRTAVDNKNWRIAKIVFQTELGRELSSPSASTFNATSNFESVAQGLSTKDLQKDLDTAGGDARHYFSTNYFMLDTGVEDTVFLAPRLPDYNGPPGRLILSEPDDD